MKKSARLILGLVITIISITWFVACAQTGQVSAKLGQEFTLAPGQSAALTGEPLKIRFLEIVADSRCPTGVTCIWAGEVSCLVEVTLQNSTNRIVLTQPGSGQAKTDISTYNVKFEVQPYPQAGKTIAKGDYLLKLLIDKED